MITHNKSLVWDAPLRCAIGVNLHRSGIELINKGNNSSRNDVDGFKIKYEHWVDITAEILNELFVSTDYSYKFAEQKSSKVEYVSSSWQPDIKYYISKELQPKIVFLKMLADNIQQFEVVVNKSERVLDNANDVAINKNKLEDNKVMPETSQTNISIKEQFESHPVIWGVSLIILGFVSGFSVRPYLISDSPNITSKQPINCTVTGLDTLEESHNMRIKTLQSQLMKLEDKSSDHNLIGSYQREYQKSADRVRQDISIENTSYKEALQQLSNICK